MGDRVVEIGHLYILAPMAALKPGDPAPDFSLPDLDGSTVSRVDYMDRPLAVVFSCCHCPYVIAWEDRINDIARAYDGRGGLVAINSNAGYLGDSPDDMRRRAEEKGFVFPFLYDESQEVARAYGAARTPEAFVFDADGRLVYHGAPDSDHRDPDRAEPYLRSALDAALAGATPETAETPPVGCTIKWRS
jgi:peroxiredoxin